jgi:ketosteroid isomerase-like protein
MSQENVELLKGLYDRFEVGDFGSLEEEFDPDFEFVTSPELPDAATYRGEDARRWFQEWLGSFEELVLEAREFLEAGEKVTVNVRQRGRPRGTAAEVSGEWWFVYTLRSSPVSERDIVRIEAFADREKALEAVGLSE